MERKSTLPRRVLAASAAVIAMTVFAPPAAAAPRNQLCNTQSWRDAHPSVCDPDGPLPGIGPGQGGGPDGGLIERILRGLGLGGLLS